MSSSTVRGQLSESIVAQYPELRRLMLFDGNESQSHGDRHDEGFDVESPTRERQRQFLNLSDEAPDGDGFGRTQRTKKENLARSRVQLRWRTAKAELDPNAGGLLNKCRNRRTRIGARSVSKTAVLFVQHAPNDQWRGRFGSNQYSPRLVLRGRQPEKLKRLAR